MIRRIQISLRPSEALASLVMLHGPVVDGVAAPGVSAATHAFGARMGQEVARAFEAHARALDVLGACLDWLERRGVARLARPRVRSVSRLCAWQCPTEVRVDVRPLMKAVADEASDPDAQARATAWALRAVLRHLANGALHACEVRAGSERVPAAEALASYDAALATVGYGANAAPPARLAHLASRSKRRDDAVEAPAVEAPPPAKASSKPEGPADVKARREAPAAKTEAPREKPRREAAAAEPSKAKSKADAGSSQTRATAQSGFGGLPDDAVPEDRRAGETYSARGLTLDAEFFLVEATIHVWPCDLKALERGRRFVVSKLHPDRAGEASTGAFHRAIKGHAELMKKLSATPAARAPEPAVEAPKPVATPPAPEPAKVVDAPVSASNGSASKPRRPRVKPAATASVPPPATASATVSAATVSSGSTYEWPPRPVEVAPPPPVAVAEPSASASANAATRPSKRGAKRVAAAARHSLDDATKLAV